jgi:uncharacterized protein YjbJ (UPF0337 family)
MGHKDSDKGFGEELKGSAKKMAGQLTGDESKEREGEAQRQKADAARDVEAKQAEAEEARRDAQALESEQRRNQ